jgi:hypothetical protein
MRSWDLRRADRCEFLWMLVVLAIEGTPKNRSHFFLDGEKKFNAELIM